MVTLDECRRVAGVTCDEDNARLQLCLDAALQYMSAAGVPSGAQDTEAYRLTACLLAAYYFDHGNAVDGNDVPSCVRAQILQMRYGNV